MIVGVIIACVIKLLTPVLQLCSGGRNLDDLKSNFERLQASIDDFDIMYNDESASAELWISKANVLEDKINTLISEYTQEPPISCFCGYCRSDCIPHCFLWSDIAPLDKEVTNLLEWQFNVKAERSLKAQRQLMEEPIGMQSLLDKVWGFLANDQDPIIGVYGMGGVGKTTLLKAVNNKLCNNSTHNFDAVLWIEVSSTPNIVDHIQNQIGKIGGFHSARWRNKSQEQKAITVFNLLETKKCIVLLDDIWAEFDIKMIGLPLPNLVNKSKVIFTTRSKQVCNHMRSSQQIEVPFLQGEDALVLFKENVGEETLNAHPDIPKLAKAVLEECGGLPLAITVIGQSMACKTSIHEWKQAIAVLNDYAAAEFSSTMENKVFIPLKYSYDNLSDDAIKACFLYCSLYRRLEYINKQELIDKWLCEGYISESHDLRKDRTQGYAVIRTLVEANLLVDSASGDYVTMHNVIRNMAIWIGGECGGAREKDTFLVKAGVQLTEMSNDVKWEHVERMSLIMYSTHVRELKSPPTVCSNLMTLFVRFDNYSLKSIDQVFFKFTPHLKVLDLSKNFHLDTLPTEIYALGSLRYLNVSGTDINKFPPKLKNLNKLRFLDVCCHKSVRIPRGVVSCLKELRVLKSFSLFKSCDDYIVKELEGLEYLNDLQTSIYSEDHLARLSSSTKLMNCTTSLRIEDCNLRFIDLGLLKTMKHLEKLRFESLKQLEEFVFREEHGITKYSTITRQDCFNNLNDLDIKGCNKLRDLLWLVFAPNIKTIEVRECRKLKTLTKKSETPFIIPFEKLVRLSLFDLPQLESIYPTCLPLPCLKDLIVRRCHKLKRLPFNSSSYMGCHISIEGNQYWWGKLEWEDEATRLAFSSNFFTTR